MHAICMTSRRNACSSIPCRLCVQAVLLAAPSSRLLQAHVRAIAPYAPRCVPPNACPPAGRFGLAVRHPLVCLPLVAAKVSAGLRRHGAPPSPRQNAKTATDSGHLDYGLVLCVRPSFRRPVLRRCRSHTFAPPPILTHYPSPPIQIQRTLPVGKNTVLRYIVQGRVVNNRQGRIATGGMIYGEQA